MNATGFEIILAGSLARFAWYHQVGPMITIAVVMAILFIADLLITAHLEDERKRRAAR